MFWRIRALTFYITISIVVITFCIVLCLPMQLFSAPYNIRYKVAKYFSYIFVYLVWFICGIKFKVEGLHKLPNDKQPYLALANHQSFWENFFMQLIVPIHSWVIKRELLDIPLFGWGLKTVLPIAVDRGNSRSVVQILNEGRKKIDAGLSIVMFPESTRIKVGSNVRFKPSAAKLAINTGIPVVLIAHNAGLLWPKGFWFKKSGTITVRIIECMSPKDIQEIGEVRALNSYIEDKITSEKVALSQLEV